MLPRAKQVLFLNVPSPMKPGAQWQEKLPAFFSTHICEQAPKWQGGWTQVSSSEPSPQSLNPSQWNFLLMHKLLAHLNPSTGQLPDCWPARKSPCWLHMACKSSWKVSTSLLYLSMYVRTYYQSWNFSTIFTALVICSQLLVSCFYRDKWMKLLKFSSKKHHVF